MQIFGEPVYRYTYRTAVIDGFLIDQDPPIQIITRNAQEGVYLSKGEQVERISPQGEVINDTWKTIRILRSPTLTVAW